MNEDEYSKKPLLVLDLKKNRIRIHKTTLRALDNPQYIQILINPNNHLVVIHKANANDYLAHKVNYEKIKSHCYELYSLELVTEIRSVASALQSKKVYTLTGDSKPQHNLIVFQLDEALALEKSVKRKEKLA